MKKLIFIALFLLGISSMYAQEMTFNCRLEYGKGVEIKDTIRRKIEKIEDKIVFENYFVGEGYELTEKYGWEKDLVLQIDSIKNKAKMNGIPGPWIYCTGPGGKYIVIGLGSSFVYLYFLPTEIEVFKEEFQALKE